MHGQDDRPSLAQGPSPQSRMSLVTDRIAAGTLAAYLSPRTWANVSDLKHDTGMSTRQIAECVLWLERNGVGVLFSDWGYKVTFDSWHRCQRLANVAA